MTGPRLDLPARYNVADVLFHNLDAGRGGKVAVRCGDEAVTYAGLAAQAARCGNALAALGIEPGARVLLLLLDTPVFPAAFWGTIRAGYVPIPANTVLPARDYAYFLQDSGARAVIVDGPLHARIAEVRGDCPELAHVIVTGGEAPPGTLSWEEVTAAAPAALDPAPTTPEDPACWAYSSGSTGFPKGVVHLQCSIPFTVEAYGKGVLGIREDDVTFSASKAFHSYGLGNNITFPYSVGASTVLFPGRPTPEIIVDHVRRYRPTLFFTAPTAYAAILAHDGVAPDDFSSVRLCVSAAEPLPPEIYRRWVDRLGVELLDGIGSTEMQHIFISNREGAVRPGSSGQIVPGYRAKVVDERGETVADGVSGDLLVSGPSASPHYWNRPDRTAATMRGDWIFTGDRYRRDEHGYFYYEGRSDDMFKVSGQWVSPIEVENTLLEHPSVFECAVVPMEDGAGLLRPRAWVVTAAGVVGDATLTAALQAHVKASLAPHTYPRVVTYVDDLPKTATGKIQRFKLREAGSAGG